MHAKARDERDPLTDLLARSGRGDRAAFSELYRRSSGRLYALCLRMLRDRGVAEEVLQDAYITIWKRADRFDPKRAAAMTWLVALVRNKAIDHLRKHRETLLDDPERINERPDEAASPVASAQTSESHRRLADCLELLDAKHRQLIREAFFSGATYKQLAARGDVPLGTMKSWIRRSLIRLRVCLEG